MDGHLRVKANECEYNERDRQLKEQFIHGINDNEMMIEIINKLAAIKNESKLSGVRLGKMSEVQRTKINTAHNSRKQ